MNPSVVASSLRNRALGIKARSISTIAREWAQIFGVTFRHSGAEPIRSGFPPEKRTVN